MKDFTISNSHGKFRIVDKKLVYEDLGSTNGSFNIHGGSAKSCTRARTRSHARPHAHACMPARAHPHAYVRTHTRAHAQRQMLIREPIISLHMSPGGVSI